MQYSIPKLHSAEDCQRLRERLGTEKVIALWATGYPRSTVDVMVRFWELLRRASKKVLLLLNASGVDIFLREYPEHKDTWVYELNDNMYLSQCPFITILFTHDYCIGSKPKDFGGKIAFFSHNFLSFPLHNANYYADYAIAVRRIVPDFPFHLYPTRAKISVNKTLTIIPCGYPKLDLLMEVRRTYGPGPHPRICFCPALLRVKAKGNDLDRHKVQWLELIEQFLITYPHWEFILRPYPPDRNAPVFTEIVRRFSGTAGFRLDSDMDSIPTLMSSDLLISDYSSIVGNFVYATLRPCIRLRLGEVQPGQYIEEKLGYCTSTASGAIQAIQAALETLDIWEQHFRTFRDKEICHAGNTLPYLVEHMDAILNDTPLPDWICVDKKDTPCIRPGEILSCLAPRKWEKYQASHYPLQAALDVHGPEPRIALAHFRLQLTQWAGSVPAIQRYLKEQMLVSLQHARPQHMIGMLRYLQKQEIARGAAAVWLAYALSRWEPAHPELRPLLALLADATLDKQLACMLARMTVNILYDHERALCILNATSVEPEILDYADALLYCFLLLEHNRLEQIKHFLSGWAGVSADFLLSVLVATCESILAAIEQGACRPVFFEAGGTHSIYLLEYPISFQNPKHAAQCLLPAMHAWEAYASRYPDMWQTCAQMYAVCGQFERTCYCMEQMKPENSHKMWAVQLSELMQKNGDSQNALRVMSFIKKIR